MDLQLQQKFVTAKRSEAFSEYTVKDYTNRVKFLYGVEKQRNRHITTFLNKQGNSINFGAMTCICCHDPLETVLQTLSTYCLETAEMKKKKKVITSNNS